jgi:hypothetical protein
MMLSAPSPQHLNVVAGLIADNKRSLERFRTLRREWPTRERNLFPSRLHRYSVVVDRRTRPALGLVSPEGGGRN